MTKDEAIKVLKEGKQDEYTRYQFETVFWTAIDMAIEALEENESLAKSLNDAAELIHKLQK